MVELNSNFENLKKNYLFVDIARKVEEYQKANPKAEVIKLGIGDVTLPLCPVVIDAMHQAVNELSDSKTFKGYGPSEGYDFLREAICKNYLRFGVKISPDEVFVSDGAKGDSANISEIFSSNGEVLIFDPSYPVYVDSSIIADRKIHYMSANKENGFLPMPDYSLNPSLIYLCSPNNPTGAAYNYAQLKQWVDYATEKKAIIIFDAAYEAFIEDKDIPHSIFEVDGAKKCSIEICSFSKGAGFTGMRCGYVVISSELKVNGKKAIDLWARRQSCKFNGAGYVSQKGAFAALSEEGIAQTTQSVHYYKSNARILCDALEKLGIWYVGGKNSPYLWLKCPNNMKSWEFFDYLLENANIIGTPGVGFGACGEGYFRLSSFGDRDNIKQAAERLKSLKF